jgi:peptidoglycan/LPS O-acetylase OafA/YrhL
LSTEEQEHPKRLLAVGHLEQRRHERSWKLSASLLGIVALIVPGVAVNFVELPGPWELVLYVAVMVAVLLGGTLWLVPSRRTGQSGSTTANNTRA